jgi:hypothetical protein
MEAEREVTYIRDYNIEVVAVALGEESVMVLFEDGSCDEYIGDKDVVVRLFNMIVGLYEE